MQSGSPWFNAGSVNAFTNVYGIDYVNAYMNKDGPLALPLADKHAPPFAPQYSIHQRHPLMLQVEEEELGTWLPEDVKYWAPDGVVNVPDQLGGGDDVTNVTIQGPASMINGKDRDRPKQVCSSRQDTPLTRLYVGLRATRDGNPPAGPAYLYTFKMELFSAGMVRRGEVEMEDWTGPTHSKLVKVWQYGRVMDSRHVEDMDEQRIMAHFFLQPPLVPLPRQLPQKPRIGSIYRGSHLGPPNGLLWSLVGAPPVNRDPNNPEFEAYDPRDAAGTIVLANLQAALIAAAGAPGPGAPLIKLAPAAWAALNIVHTIDPQNKDVTLFYNKYVVVGGYAYLPAPDENRGDREGAFDLEFLQHGRDSDPWGQGRLLPDGSYVPGPRAEDGNPPNLVAGVPYPPVPATAAAPAVIDEVTYGRRPAWWAADVEQQLKRREFSHTQRYNYDGDDANRYVYDY
jgi:hypothetical protein